MHVYQLATPGDATISVGADISFSHHDSLDGISHTGGTAAVTIDTTGTYRIDYSARTSAAIEAEIAIAVNDVVDVSTSIPVTDSGSVELSLIAGDVITLRNNPAVSFALELSPQIGAKMYIVKKN